MHFHPIAEKLPLLEGAELDELVRSIRTNGFDKQHPILLYDGKILDGRNRFVAAKKAGVEPVYRNWDGGNPWDFVWRENATRRHLDAGTRACIYLSFHAGSEAWEAARQARSHKANQVRSIKTKGQARSPDGRRLASSGHVSSDTRPDKGKASREWERTHIAQSAGVSPATAARALELRKKDPAKFKEVTAGKVALDKALKETKLAEKRALGEKLRVSPLPEPGGVYQVIVVDPPWRYDEREEDTTHRGNTDYPTMSVEQICALPVSKLADDNCVLWLWTTNAMMRHAYACLDAWGFRDKTILTWDKQLMGVGNWLRNVTEHCLLAVRGRPVTTLTKQTTLLSERRRQHSRKPEAFYALVEELCPGSKLEMFARTPRKGWAAWGAESARFPVAR